LAMFHKKIKLLIVKSVLLIIGIKIAMI
jgi:hypothetical protein